MYLWSSETCTTGGSVLIAECESILEGLLLTRDFQFGWVLVSTDSTTISHFGLKEWQPSLPSCKDGRVCLWCLSFIDLSMFLSLSFCLYSLHCPDHFLIRWKRVLFSLCFFFVGMVYIPVFLWLMLFLGFRDLFTYLINDVLSCAANKIIITSSLFTTIKFRSNDSWAQLSRELIE